MASKKNGGVMGFDPLAWMKDSSQESTETSRESKAGGSQNRSGAVDVDSRLGVQDSRLPTPDSGSKTPDSPGAIALGEILTIEQVAATYAELGRALGATSIALEAGALQRVDAAGLQLLAAFVRAADSHGARIEWRSPSAALRDAARRTGLTAVLRLA